MKSTFFSPGKTTRLRRLSVEALESRNLLHGGISGFVFIDVSNYGSRDAGESGVPGVLLTLSGQKASGGGVLFTSITDDHGQYLFDNLEAGTYSITERQPAALLDGKESALLAGVAIGEDTISNIVLGGNQTATDINFGEFGLRPAFIGVGQFLASTAPTQQSIREMVAHAEERTGNGSLAATIRSSQPVLITNAAPVANADSYSSTAGGVLTIPRATGVLANDTDAERNALTAQVILPPAHGQLSLNSDGSFAYTPAGGFTGTDSFTYAANDGAKTSAAVAVNISVNAPNLAPVAAADNYTVGSDSTLTVAAQNGVLINDSDADSVGVTAQIATSPAHGSLNLNANGSFSYQPSAGFVGTDTFTYRVSDGTLLSNLATVTITVTQSNRVPVAAADSYSTNRDTPLNVIASQGLLANDSDPDSGSTLASQVVANPTHGALSLNANGSFVYTPAVGYTGADSFTYRTSDGTATSATVTVSLTVLPVNRAPTAQADSFSVAAGSNLVIGSATGVLFNDTDPDGDSLTAMLVSQASHGSLTLNANGSFTYAPTPGYSGPDGFTYLASDGTASSATVTVSLTVLQGNRAPIAQADSFSVAAGSNLVIGSAAGVLSNDTDADGDSLTATLISPPAHGELIVNPNGSFTYAPTLGFSGQDSFTYRATDGTAQSSSATVTIDVIQQNDFTVSESVTAGTIVGQISAVDEFGTPVLYQIADVAQAAQLQLKIDDHLQGDPAAPVIIVEYLDLSCPRCRDIHPVVQQLMSQFEGKILLVQRHLLLFNATTGSFIFPNSQMAARAAEAAGRQGKFDEMVDKLFDNQNTWRNANFPSTYFDQYAQDLGLNLTQFAADQIDPTVEGRIARDRNEAASLSLTSAPSFYINGVKTANPQTITAFAPLITNALTLADSPFGINRKTGQIFVNNPEALDAALMPLVAVHVAMTNDANVTQIRTLTFHVT